MTMVNGCTWQLCLRCRPGGEPVAEGSTHRERTSGAGLQGPVAGNHHPASIPGEQ